MKNYSHYIIHTDTYLNFCHAVIWWDKHLVSCHILDYRAGLTLGIFSPPVGVMNVIDKC